MSETQPQTITPERQIAAQQIGAVFNSIHEYLRTLQHKDAAGEMLMSKQLEYAHARVDEAAMWSIKHVLTFGPPPAPKAANDESKPAADAAPAAPVAEAAPVADETPVEVDLRSNSGQPLPQTDGGTPTEAV